MTTALSATNTSHRTLKKGLIFALIAALFFGLFAAKDTYAAATTTTTRTYTPFYADGGLRILDMYGKDTFKITYEKGKKVVSVKTSQTARNLGTKMLEPGGIKLVSKNNSTWTYESTWYLNLSVFPTSLTKLAKKYVPGIELLSNMGRIGTKKITYTVDKNGCLKYVKSTGKLQVPSKLTDAAKKLGKLFHFNF